MKILLQRVSSASVTVANNVIASIDQGVLLFVGFGQCDEKPEFVKAASKVLNMRIFENDEGKLHHSLLDIAGEILVVPQFTLYASTSKGRRPDFTPALAPSEANIHFKSFVTQLKQASKLKVETGQFGANMAVGLINEGPLTLLLEY